MNKFMVRCMSILFAALSGILLVDGIAKVLS